MEEESEFEYEKCFVCSKKITVNDERPEKKVDFNVHAHCFNCSLCSTSLDNVDFQKCGTLLCTSHYAQLINMKNSNVSLRGDLLGKK